MSELQAFADVANSGVWSAAGAWAAWRLLGPPALELTEFARRRLGDRLGNTDAILQRAAAIPGDDLEQPGGVHPRVAAKILDEGSNISDPVMQAYLAGMLRASRTPLGDDDRATYYLGLITAMTANQVRLHHAIYAAVAAHERSETADIGDPEHQVECSVLTTIADAQRIVSTPAGDAPEDVLAEAVAALGRDGLIAGLAVGEPDLLAKGGINVEEPSLAACPNSMGALLYLWGHGRRTARPDSLGRVAVAPCDPPGPTFARCRVGGWFDPPMTRARVDSIAGGRAMTAALMFGGS